MIMRVEDWGRLAFRPAWERQLEVWEAVVAGGPDTLVLVEHDPVVTLGAGSRAEHLLLDEADYAERGIEVVPIDRGGDVTYHGPGQLVIYPLFDIRRHGQDLHRWLRDLEETMIHVARRVGVEAVRFPPNTGVWVGQSKLAAIGIKARKWVSIHGIALNCADELAGFDTIVPCGIVGYGVTSLTHESGRAVTPDDAKPLVVEAFQAVFGVN